MTNTIKKDKYVGVLIDDRPEELKSRDFKSTDPELASATPLKWVEKSPEKWKNYPARNQSNSSSCVAQAICKALYVMGNGVDSAHPIYRMRSNYASEGMWLFNGGDIMRSQGTVLETDALSQNVGESYMNGDIPASARKKLIEMPIKTGAYVFTGKDINSIAQAIEDHGHCVITVGSNYDEWSSIPKVQGTVKWGHAICAIDYVLYKGKKYIVIEDSWGSNIGDFDDRRLLSAEFLAARCSGAMYFLKYVEPAPFNGQFTKNLQRGSQGIIVQNLQKALQKFGFFPAITPTKYYGIITENAMKKFQLAYKDDILTPIGLTIPTGNFGDLTRKKLNSLIK